MTINPVLFARTVNGNGGPGRFCLIPAATPPRDLGLPPSRLDGAAPGGGGEVPAGLPEGAGEGAGAPAQPLDPAGGEELLGGDRRASLGPPEQRGDGDAQADRQAGRRRLEGHPGRRPAGGRLAGLAQAGRDELPGAQDPRIGLDGGAGPARGRDRLPPPESGSNGAAPQPSVEG